MDIFKVPQPRRNRARRGADVSRCTPEMLASIGLRRAPTGESGTACTRPADSTRRDCRHAPTGAHGGPQQQESCARLPDSPRTRDGQRCSGRGSCARLSPVRHGRTQNRTRSEEGSRPYAPDTGRIRTGQRTHWCVNVPMTPCPVLLLRRHQPGSLVVNMTGSAARLGGSPGPVFVFRIKQGCAWSR